MEISSFSELAYDYWLIDSDTIVTSNFELHHMSRGFYKRLIKFNNERKNCGFILVHKYGRSAIGQIEGTIENIEKFKSLIDMECIPKVFVNRASFTPYVRQRNPKFHVFERIFTWPPPVKKQEEVSTSSIDTLH